MYKLLHLLLKVTKTYIIPNKANLNVSPSTDNFSVLNEI